MTNHHCYYCQRRIWWWQRGGWLVEMSPLGHRRRWHSKCWREAHA